MTITVIDKNGVPQNMDWVQSNYGAVEFLDPDPKPASWYQVTAIHEIEGPMVFQLTVSGADGMPVVGQRVIYSWPDADPLPGDSGWDGYGIVELTNGYGTAEHTAGSGEMYYPPNVGPISWWVYGVGVSQCIRGVGWLAGTNHRHLQFTMKLLGDGEPEPPIPPEPGDMTAFEEAIVDLGERFYRLLEDHLTHTGGLTGELD